MGPCIILAVKLTMRLRLLGIKKIITAFTRCISSIRIGLPVFMVDVSEDKYISRGIIRDETVNCAVSKTLHKGN